MALSKSSVEGLSGPPLPGHTFGLGLKIIKIEPLAKFMIEARGGELPPPLVVSCLIDCGEGRVAMYDFPPEDLTEVAETLSRYAVAFKAFQEGRPEPLQALVDTAPHGASQDGGPAPKERPRIADFLPKVH